MSGSTMYYWVLMSLATAILWGICYSSTGEIVKWIDIKTYLMISCLMSFIGFLVWGACDNSLNRDMLSFNMEKARPWVIISSLSSFLACYCSVSAVKYGGASLAAIIEISYPVWVVVFTYLMFGKGGITINTVLGGILIFLGTVVVVRGTHVN